MQRGKQIVWLIRSAKPVERSAQPAAGVRAFEGEAKREKEEANARATRIAAVMRLVKVASSRWFRQRNGAPIKKASIDR